MYAILIGLAAGVLVGALNHWLVHRACTGRAPTAAALSGLRNLFLIRYVAVGATLVGFRFCSRSLAGEVVLALGAVGSSRWLLRRDSPPGE